MNDGTPWPNTDARGVLFDLIFGQVDDQQAAKGAEEVAAEPEVNPRWTHVAITTRQRQAENRMSTFLEKNAGFSDGRSVFCKRCVLHSVSFGVNRGKKCC